MTTKVKLNISIDTDTKERLQQYAEQNHKSVSQAVTDWIWTQPIKGSNAAETEMEKKDDD